MYDSSDSESYGILFDTTLCIGCGGCYEACKEEHQLPETAEDFLQDKLSANTFNILQEQGDRYMRRMCMHCAVPTCVSVCPVGALQKTAEGPVVYEEERCMGCRYCMQACPFNVPKYEWSKTLPRVQKCDMCMERIRAGQATACSEACPAGATTFGKRSELLAEARERIASDSSYYDHVFGATEIGGTSVLIISDVSPAELGLPQGLASEPLPLLTSEVLGKIPGFSVLSCVLLGGIWWITKRREEVRRAERPEGRKRA